MKQMIFNDDGIAIGARYAVGYDGYLFYGDSDGFNRHEVDNFAEAMDIYNAYPEIVTVYDNYYDVSFANGEWA